MRAAILTAPGSPLSLEPVTPVGLGANDVLVRIAASGVCHTDLLRARGHAAIECPVILGHEGAGSVEEVGENVTRVRKGDRVIASWVPACGSCYWCANGQSNLCVDFGRTAAVPRMRRSDGSVATAFTGLGTFAEAMVVHENSLVRVESDLPFEQLALVGCAVMTGVGAVINTARVTPGSAVAVIGCGGIGQAVVQGARLVGAATIVAIDPVAAKREAAEAFGATIQLDPAACDPVEAVREVTGGRGADYVFEASGAAATLLPAFEMTRRGGTLVPVGVQPVGTTFPWTAGELMLTGRRVLGCLYGSADIRRDFPRLVALVEAGRLDLASMVSRRIPIDDLDSALDAIDPRDADAWGVIRSVVVT